MRDRVIVEGLIIEETFDWFAQDDAGNVWYMGESVTDFEYDDAGELIGMSHSGQWEAGVDGAMAGYQMPANPRLGQHYYQEFFAGEAEDEAEIVGLNEFRTIPFGRFDNVLRTRESTALEQSVLEHKFYAPGIGKISSFSVDFDSGATGQGTLVSFTSGMPRVVLNEYNAVGPDRWLDVGEGPSTPDDPMNDPLTASEKRDNRLGRIMGNGGDWFELAVVGAGMVGDTVDMRGWKFVWEEAGESGEIVLSNHEFWENVRAGTIITFGEDQTIVSRHGREIVNGSDVSIDFDNGDNWVHIFSGDADLIATTESSVEEDLDDEGNPIFGRFSVANDGWNLSIFDSESEGAVFGPIGEGIGGAVGGVNSREVFKLEADVSPEAGFEYYSDGTTSTFGAPNVWTVEEATVRQDFSQYGVVPEPSGICGFLSCLIVLVARTRRK